jgi:anti-anti-sigma factor
MREPHYRRLKSETEGDVLVLRITQALVMDENVIDDLREDLLSALDHHKPGKLVLDFQHVKALSSDGFRPLISLHRRTQESGCRLVLCGLGGMVAEVFRLSGLISDDPVAAAPFTSTHDLPSALGALKR